MDALSSDLALLNKAGGYVTDRLEVVIDAVHDLQRKWLIMGQEVGINTL